VADSHDGLEILFGPDPDDRRPSTREGRGNELPW
jgi:hypothetical protein